MNRQTCAAAEFRSRAKLINKYSVISRTGGQPATVESLATDLIALGVQTGSTVLVHSSLSSMGWVCGGPTAVIAALKAAGGKAGTLVMPAHSSDVSEPSLWSNPPVPESWWPTIRMSMPPFAPDLTPTRGMGTIAECFRSMSNVIRSNHPHVSFAALGPNAAEITTGHQLTPSLGDASPLGRLYELNAFVLLLGVDHDSNTSLHLSEVRALQGKSKLVATGAPMMVDGCREWIEFHDFDYDDSDFPALGRDFVTESDEVKTGRVASAGAVLMPMKELVDFGVAWLMEVRVRPD